MNNRITDPEVMVPLVRAALIEKAAWHAAQHRAAELRHDAAAVTFHKVRIARLDAQIRNRVGWLGERGLPTMLEVAEARCAYNRETVRREEAAAEVAQKARRAADKRRREEAALARAMADAARRASELVAAYNGNGHGKRQRGVRAKHRRSYAEANAA